MTPCPGPGCNGACLEIDQTRDDQEDACPTPSISAVHDASHDQANRAEPGLPDDPHAPPTPPDPKVADAPARPADHVTPQ